MVDRKGKKTKESTEEERKLARKLREKGKSNKEIASLLNKSTRWVQRWFKTHGRIFQRELSQNSLIRTGQIVCQRSLTGKGTTTLNNVNKM